MIDYAKNLGMTGEFTPDAFPVAGQLRRIAYKPGAGIRVFCAQGVAAEPIFITRILSRDGTVLEDNRPRLAQAISPETAFLITSMLQSVVEEGTGKKVRALNRPCAGKTGTTNDVRDAWFIGFTPQLVAGVWLGFDDLSPLGKHETGGVAASPVWLDFMQQALQNEPVQPFKVPEGIIYVKVNPKTGLPPASGESGIFECFRDGTAPGMDHAGGAADNGQ